MGPIFDPEAAAGSKTSLSATSTMSGARHHDVCKHRKVRCRVLRTGSWVMLSSLVFGRAHEKRWVLLCWLQASTSLDSIQGWGADEVG